MAHGLHLAEQKKLDGAVLDTNLNGDRCCPIAETFKGRGVPFVFLTGYDSSTVIPAELRASCGWASRCSSSSSSRCWAT